MKQSLKNIFDAIADVLISQKWQNKIARHVLNRNLGEGVGNPEINGEYYLLEKVKQHYRNKESCVIFDIGANIGEWTVKIAQNMGPNLIIHSFEPSKKTYERLKEIKNIKYEPQIHLYNHGLSDKSGEAEFYVCGQTAGTNSLYKRQAECIGVTQGAREKIVLEKGDEFCQELGLEHIDFIKIDTEGHELSVLKGFDKMLSAHKIDMIQFEYGGCWVDAGIFLMDAFNYLLPKGYYLGKIYPKGVKVFTAYDQRLDNFVYCNYIVFKSENELIKKMAI